MLASHIAWWLIPHLEGTLISIASSLSPFITVTAPYLIKRISKYVDRISKRSLCCEVSFKIATRGLLGHWIWAIFVSGEARRTFLFPISEIGRSTRPFYFSYFLFFINFSGSSPSDYELCFISCSLPPLLTLLVSLLTISNSLLSGTLRKFFHP